MKRFLRAYGGRIAYYGGIVAVLCAVAYAAEIYRSGDNASDELILPAVELETAARVLQPEEPTFVLPEGALCIREFSADPEWNEELKQWEAHMAADYTFEGGEVASFCSGTVLTIGESGLLGGFVEVESGKILLRYASIEPDPNLEVGMELRMGDRIGATADGIPSEAGLEPHLHLEIYQVGNPVDVDTML